MKKMHKRYFMVLAVSVMIFSQSCAYAADPDKAPKDTSKQDAEFDKIGDEIKLTPEQKEKISKDRNSFFSRSKDILAKLRSARAELKSEFEKPGLDEGKINKLAADIKNLLSQQVQSRVDSIITMKRIMTPEQFTKMTNTVKRRREAIDIKTKAQHRAVVNNNNIADGI